MMKAQLIPILAFLCFAGLKAQTGDFRTRLSDAAIDLTKIGVVYDPAYYVISYPGGDLPENRGVCTDVIIRAYRTLDIDLQKEIHEDMMADFDSYPDNWGLNSPDKNIDHRRVPNLMVFFEKHGTRLPVSRDASDYGPGEVVCWNLGGGITHIGIIVDRKSPDGTRNMIVHNIGKGQVMEDCLFNFKIIGHYFYE
jgi:uncharacterized protein YijF (DUF1287 family)